MFHAPLRAARLASKSWLNEKRRRRDQRAGSGRATKPCPRGRHAPVAGRLIEYAVARNLAGEDGRVGILLDLEGIETGAQQEHELVAQHVAGRAQLAAEFVGLAQKARLAIGAAVAEFGEFEGNECQA